jgi:hypothetical protein
MLFAFSKSSLGRADRCANVSQIKRRVWVCFQKLLEPCDNTFVAQGPAAHRRGNALSHASDQRVNHLVLQCRNDSWKLEKFGLGLGYASDHLM